MVNEPKRISIIAHPNTGVGNQVSSRFGPGTGTILRRMVNYHNIWFGFTCEPINADANASGQWVLWLKANTNDPDTTWSTANFLTDDFTMQVIACGVWSASNQSPYTFSSQLKSSRNLVANQELVLTVHPEGISAGQISIDTSLCAGLSVK